MLLKCRNFINMHMSCSLCTITISFFEYIAHCLIFHILRIEWFLHCVLINFHCKLKAFYLRPYIIFVHTGLEWGLGNIMIMIFGFRPGCRFSSDQILLIIYILSWKLTDSIKSWWLRKKNQYKYNKPLEDLGKKYLCVWLLPKLLSNT